MTFWMYSAALMLYEKVEKSFLYELFSISSKRSGNRYVRHTSQIWSYLIYSGLTNNVTHWWRKFTKYVGTLLNGLRGLYIVRQAALDPLFSTLHWTSECTCSSSFDFERSPFSNTNHSFSILIEVSVLLDILVLNNATFFCKKNHRNQCHSKILSCNS